MNFGEKNHSSLLFPAILIQSRSRQNKVVNTSELKLYILSPQWIHQNMKMEKIRKGWMTETVTSWHSTRSLWSNVYVFIRVGRECFDPSYQPDLKPPTCLTWSQLQMVFVIIIQSYQKFNVDWKYFVSVLGLLDQGWH